MSCTLFTADDRPLQQAGCVDLTLEFSVFPNFILTNVEHALLGLDFLFKYNFVVNTASKSVSMSASGPDNDELPFVKSLDYNTLSYKDILNLFHLNDVSASSSSKRHPHEHILEVDGPPVAFRPRRLSLEKATVLDAMLDDMLAKNIIRPTCSPWASPVHLVKKKNGSFRLVHDYRHINTHTKKQNYPLPRISDLTQKIRGATIFSSLDLKCLLAIARQTSDRKYTVFCTSRGNFEYNRLPQGLTYASSSFQKFINHVMKGTESFCFCYIDDIIIFSQNEHQHKKHLHDVANRLAAYSLKLNFNKCLLGVSQLTALGYMLSTEGLAASDDKIKAIQQLPEPKTVKELRQALGLINYQRKFIPNAARILAPLNALL